MATGFTTLGWVLLVVITADGGYRRGKVIHLKEQVDRSLLELAHRLTR